VKTGWAGERSDFDDPSHEQRQRDGVLIAAKEALGPVDRIERPESPETSRAAGAIDPAEDLVAIGDSRRPTNLLDDSGGDRGVVGARSSAASSSPITASLRSRARARGRRSPESEVGDRDGTPVALRHRSLAAPLSWTRRQSSEAERKARSAASISPGSVLKWVSLRTSEPLPRGNPGGF